MSDDLINIEVDGRPLKARKGQMLMQVTDDAGIYIPRFCYHEKLTVAANCRMCLVEVEKAPKPLPACATPVAEGMKAFTRSPRAIAAQKATMEFLLINHPLDCPICDQGGECELQDLAQGFGSSVSRFTERKRVVADKDLGPLISTDMTRCIHCTRCVRFTAEIAGLQELGTTGRGEDMQIGTWIERSVDHELSGNIIDLCPVGALNSKPFRHRGRSWEMTQHALVSPHDPVGSNLYAHVLRGRLMRVVPRRNEEVNETWLADRDRFSYEGIYAPDRLAAPMVKSADGWREVDWETALMAAASDLKALVQGGGPASIGFLGSPSATTEELYLLGRLARGLGCGNVDTRLRQTDFRGQQHDPPYPGLDMSLADVGRLDALLVIGSRLRHEAPILAHRVRTAAVTHGARVSFLNSAPADVHFPVEVDLVVRATGLTGELAGLLAAAARGAGRELPAGFASLTAGAKVTEAHEKIVQSLAGHGRRAVLLGAAAFRHPAFAELRAAATALAELTGATLAMLPEGGNAAGAALAGALPHREAGGRPAAVPGLDVRRMLEQPLAGYLLFGGIEPEFDTAVPRAARALSKAHCIVAVTPYATDAMRHYAHVLLPMGTFAETSGTYVNVAGTWQSHAGCIAPLGAARPGWKILRVLGNLLDVVGFDYESSEQVREELRTIGVAAPAGTTGELGPAPEAAGVDVHIYAVDAVVRRAASLQRTALAQGVRQAARAGEA
jgi:NADH-quinone oxidoreductase subunit G